MLNKILSILLAILFVVTLAACGETTETHEDTVQNPVQETEAAEVPAETTAPVVFEETILVDDENCTFKVTAIDADNLWGYTLKVYLENKTNKELTFSVNDVSVNGFMCDPFWAANVTADMKANEEISFSKDSFSANGITTVTDIAFTLSVYDSNDWTADHLVSDVFSIYPCGEDAVQTYERTPQNSDIVLFDNESCSMIITGFDPDNIWGYTVNVYLENKTDKNLMFSLDGAAVNGFMCDPYWADTVAAGKRSNTSISWMASEFEENGITDVESLTLPIRVYDSDDWTADDLVDETFTVNP